MKVIQIRGAGGSGKTTLMKQLISVNDAIAPVGDKDHSYEAQMQVGLPKPLTYATYLPAVNWAILGHYDEGRHGGCDGYPHPGTIDFIKMALKMVVETTPKLYALAFEGLMISTISSTFYEYLLGNKDKWRIQPLFIGLNATPEGCAKRIKASRTGSTSVYGVDLDHIAHKCYTVMHGMESYDRKYTAYMDVEDIALDRMLPTFLSLVGDNDLASYVSRWKLYGTPDSQHSQRHI